MPLYVLTFDSQPPPDKKPERHRILIESATAQQATVDGQDWLVSSGKSVELDCQRSTVTAAPFAEFVLLDRELHPRKGLADTLKIAAASKALSDAAKKQQT